MLSKEKCVHNSIILELEQISSLNRTIYDILLYGWNALK